MNAHQQPDDLDLAGSEAILSGADTASQPELAAALDALRAPASPSELAAAAELVPQLAAAARQSTGPGALARSSRRMVMLGAAGAMMVGGAAAAATGALDPILPDPEPAPAVELVELEDEVEPEIRGHDDDEDGRETPAVPAAEVPTVAVEMQEEPPGWLTDEIRLICEDPDANHGEYVSTVAQLDDDQLGEDVSNRGQVVRDAARDKDCDGEPDEKIEVEDEGEEKKDGEKGKDGRPHEDEHDDRGDDDDDESGQGQGGKDKKDKKDESDDD